MNTAKTEKTVKPPSSEWQAGFAEGRRAREQKLRSTIERMRQALLEAEVGLEFAGADEPQTTAFIPTPTSALRIVRQALKKA